MACARCPYTSSYQLLWQHTDDPPVVAVMLRCCAGPELQVRRGPMVLLSEIFTTPSAVVSRAEELRGTFSPEEPYEYANKHHLPIEAVRGGAVRRFPSS